MEFILLIAFCFTFCGYIQNICCSNFTASFSKITYNWSTARQTKSLIGYDLTGSISDIRVTLKESGFENTFGWIDGLSAYQPWMEYQGCLVVAPLKIRYITTVTSGRQFLDCVKLCLSAYTYIGLQQTKCVCLDSVTIGSADVVGTCTTNLCTGDGSSYCATDSIILSRYAVYKRSPAERTISSGVGGCLVLTINRAQGFLARYETAPCGTVLRPLCYRNGSPQALSTTTSWGGALAACTSNSATLTSPYQIAGSSIGTADGSYWLAQNRKANRYLFKDYIAATENYCLAARVTSSGQLDVIERSCDMLLPALFVDSSIGPRQNETTVTPEVTRSKNPPMSGDLIAIAAFIPSLLVVAVVSVGLWFAFKYCKCLNRNIPAKDRDSVKRTAEPISYYESSESYSKQPTDTSVVEPQEEPEYHMLGSDTYLEINDTYHHINHGPLGSNDMGANYSHAAANTHKDDSNEYHTLSRDEKPPALFSKMSMETDDEFNNYNSLSRDNRIVDTFNNMKNSTYDRMSSIRRNKSKDLTDKEKLKDNYDMIAIETDELEHEEELYDHLDHIE